MKRSLLDRFRGLFLGIAVGEVYLGQTQGPEPDRQTINDLAHSRHQGEHQRDSLGELRGQEICSRMAQALIESQFTLPLEEALPKLGLPRQGPSLLAAVLPMALFFHDDLARLDQQIHQLLHPAADLELEASGLVIGRTIAMICQEQVTPKTWITYLLEQVDIPHSSIIAGLEQVQVFLQSKATLMEVLHNLSASSANRLMPLSSDLSLAFYCWLSTADAFNLSMKRSGQPPQSQLRTRLTTALSGVYNGVSGIPLAWQAELISGTGSSSHGWQGADALLAAWSGCSHLESAKQISPRLLRSAIAAPGLLRPRPK
ncbi:MAG: hypothetical protein HC934_02360 [Acaryochloridaceae cyanobacterium SU_2_1]|nr:hypothetical protein [Acaryochloridaceae cyanobacterium SU_2_1]NJM95097.1 hypothetical protein [Acaryochloridaceae cyanobacterium CSU_5_19]